MDAFETVVCEASKPLQIISNQFGACIKLPKSYDFSFTCMFENFNGSPLGADLCEPMNHCVGGFFLVSDEVYKFEDIFNDVFV